MPLQKNIKIPKENKDKAYGLGVGMLTHIIVSKIIPAITILVQLCCPTRIVFPFPGEGDKGDGRSRFVALYFYKTA